MMQVYYRVPAIILAVLLLALWCMPLPAEAQETEEGNQDNQDNQTEEDDTIYHGTYYEQEQLNAGLPERSITDDLQTPQATLEHFVLSARHDDFETAGYALNLSLIPVRQQSVQAPELSRKLYYLLQQNALIDWDSLPDRPDGQIDTSSSQNKNPLVGSPRRNIRLGSIALNDRDIPIRIQRVKTEGQRPVWLFSASTVENIPVLYEEYKPGFLAQRVPAWAKVEVAGDLQLWEWAAIVVFVVVSGVAGWLIRLIFDHAFSNSANAWWRGLTDTIANPVAVFVGLTLLYVLTRNLLSLTGSFTRFFDYTIVVLLILVGTWLVMRSIKFISDYIVDQHILNQAERDIGYARQLSTYLFVGRRVVLFLALIGGTMLLLRFFGVFERVSISLLASAGLFTVILGVAAQHVLGDIIAGLQIALTQPIRVGDTIEFEEAWGTVERITYTYLTIYTWDERRVVVPLQYFMSRPSQNLTKTNANLIKPIYLYVDYHTNIDHIREAFTQLLEHDEDWDRNIPPTVNVTNITHEAIEVRLLCSASDPDTAWYLRFRISERIMAYLRDMKSGPYLPKQRMVIEHTDHFNGQPQHNDWHRQREHTAENAWKMPDVILRETSDSHRQPDQDHSADHH